MTLFINIEYSFKSSSNSKLLNTNLINANLENANLFGVDLTNSKIDGTIFKNIKKEFVDNIHVGSKSSDLSNFQYVDFTNKDLKEVDFSYTDLTGANFNGADLTGASFYYSTLTGASFDNANLENAKLTGAELEQTSFVNTNLKNSIKGNKIDKKTIREEIFKNTKKKKLLEKYLHAKVKKSRDIFLKKNRQKKTQIVFLDIPLLFENKLEKICNYTILFYAPLKIRKQRAIRRRGMQKRTLEKIIKSQLSDKIKKQKADFIVNTSTSKSRCFNKILKTIKTINNFEQFNDDHKKYALAIANYKLSNLKNGNNLINQLIQKYPENPYFYELKAQMLRENGYLNDALKNYLKSQYVSTLPYGLEQGMLCAA